MVAWAVAFSLPHPLSGQDSILRAPGVHEYVRQVLVGNAGYAAARSRVAAAAERIAPAGALPDPTVTLGILAVPAPSFDFTAERMTRLPIGVRQHIPFPGKQAAATDRARADSALAGESLVAIEARLVAEAAGVYYELAYAETALRIWQSRVVLADQAIAVAHTRYETGAAPQTDLLRARLRRAELEEEGWDLEAAVVQVRAHADGVAPQAEVHAFGGAALREVGFRRFGAAKADEMGDSMILWRNGQVSRRGLLRTQPLDLHVVGNDLAIALLFTHATRDELRVLRAEVEDEDRFVGHGGQRSVL